MAQVVNHHFGARFIRRAIRWAAITGVLLLGVSPRAAAQADSAWRFTVMPYFWASDLTGKVGVGPIGTNVDLSFRDIVKVLKFGAMGYLEARYKSYVVGIDGIFSSIGNGQTVAFRGDTGSFAFTQKEWIVQPIVGYTFHHGLWALEPIVGFRYWSLNTDLDVTRPNGTVHERSGGVDWVDATVGGRANWVYRPKRVRFLAGGDVGGGGAKSTWQLYGTAGWDAANWFTLSAGYRTLSVDYDKNILLMDTNMKGPIVTFAFRF